MAMGEGQASGKWPASNSEPAVRSWLTTRLQKQFTEDPREGQALLRWMLEAATGKPLGVRMMAAPFRFSEHELNVLAAWSEGVRNGRPIQHMIGQVMFMGLSLEVGPVALVPRPETEEMTAATAQWLLDKFKASPSSDLRGVDVGTGSGCIAVSLKHHLADWPFEMVAEDVSQEALALAQRNAARAGENVIFRHQDALNFMPGEGEAWDLVISNPPYIPASERELLPEVVRLHDPDLALFVPDEQPLLFYEALLRRCLKGGLRPGGACVVECHERFASAVAKLFSTDFDDVRVENDLQGKPRFVWAVAPK